MSNENVVIVGAARTPIGMFQYKKTNIPIYHFTSCPFFIFHCLHHILWISGILNGSLSSLKAHELGSAAITGALIRSNVRPEEVSDVIMGQVSFFCMKLMISFQQ